MSVIDSANKKFLFLNSSANEAERNNDDSSTVRISLPFKDQVAANPGIVNRTQSNSIELNLWIEFD